VSWQVVVRTGPAVHKYRAASLDDALELLETETRVAANTTRRPEIDVRVRHYAPADQVAARAELRGPGPRAGFDVRGDGSVQAWTGRVRRRMVEPEGDETVYEALRRELTATAGIRPAP
jgi:hypothetical protein